jgi:uncharacterized lipoprotein YehR (DUF1307 family)
MKYSVELVVNGMAEDTYITDSLSNAQAKFDSWEQDFQNDTGVTVKLYLYDESTDEYTEVNYNGEVI